MQSFIISHQPNGTLKVVSLIKLKDFDGKNIFGSLTDLLYELDSKDLDFYVSHQDGWQYIYDERKDVVYWVTDYNYDMWNELRKVGVAILKPHPNTKEDYGDYEWNEGRSWRTIRKSRIVEKKSVKRKVNRK